MTKRFCVTTIVPLAAVLGSALLGASVSEPEAADIPVVGTFVFDHFGKASGVPVIGAVHSVQRIAGGTAAFYSIGVPGGYDTDLKTRF